MIKDLQKKFIENEIYILAWNASVQHNPVYALDCSINNRSKFRKDIILYLINYILPMYDKKITENDHYNNIVNLRNYAEKIGKNILLNKYYKIGTAQKLLNLSLKYFWCIGWIKEPPNCPVDRIILGKAGINNLSWTKINTIKEYKSIIDNIRKKVKRNDLAQWELEVFNRR